MSQKTGYAKYTFAFASDIQKLADEKHIKVLSFSTKERKGVRGSYDFLEVRFLVPRPDRDREPTYKLDDLDTIAELGNEPEKDNEVYTDEI